MPRSPRAWPRPPSDPLCSPSTPAAAWPAPPDRESVSAVGWGAALRQGIVMRIAVETGGTYLPIETGVQLPEAKGNVSRQLRTRYHVSKEARAFAVRHEHRHEVLVAPPAAT